MQAIEFNSQLEHGQITVPKTLHLAEGQPVRVFILLDEIAGEQASQLRDTKSVWVRTAGAWQGERANTNNGCNWNNAPWNLKPIRSKQH